MKNKKIKLGHVPEDIRPEGIVSPLVAAICSLIIPGLGQILARTVRRGLIVLFSFASLLGLIVWRFILAAPRDTGWLNIVKKGLRLEPMMILVSLLFITLYIWIAFDAYSLAKFRDRTPVGIFFFLLVMFFVLGLQIGQINPITFVTGLDDGLPLLGKVAWPWEKAFTYPETTIRGSADIEIPCSDSPPEESQITLGEPSLIVTPTCGDLSEVDGTPGSVLHLSGRDFIPGTVVDIKWSDPIFNIFYQREAGDIVRAVPDSNGDFELDITMPYRLLPPSAADPTYIWELYGEQIEEVGDPVLSKEFKLIVEKMVETIFIGMMATFFGVIFALPVSFIAARNLMSTRSITLSIYYVTRAILNIIRSIEPLIWAIIAVIVVGLGPFAGILALTIHSIAALGKLYSEAIESIDTGPIEAIQATGATWLQTVVYAVVPQIVPPFVAFTIYRWDINIRMSTVVGFVGGGGVGFLLAQYIRILDYRSAGMAVWFIAITVAILDYVSAEIRARSI